jgi:RNA polymerase sigma-70 factor (ECF subfamily)
LPVRKTRPVPHGVCLRDGLSLVPPAASSVHPENPSAAPAPVLHSQAPQSARSRYLQFDSFDDAYFNRLRAGDSLTQKHFMAYFGELVKIVARYMKPEEIEDVRQETFLRVFVAIETDKIRQPNRLAAFVNSVCKNVIRETRRGDQFIRMEEEFEANIPAPEFDFVRAIDDKDRKKKVEEVLGELAERDRRILCAIFLEERDKDEICRDFGVSRDFLRVLLFRAKQSFKSRYRKR